MWETSSIAFAFTFFLGRKHVLLDESIQYSLLTGSGDIVQFPQYHIRTTDLIRECDQQVTNRFESLEKDNRISG